MNALSSAGMSTLGLLLKTAQTSKILLKNECDSLNKVTISLFTQTIDIFPKQKYQSCIVKQFVFSWFNRHYFIYCYSPIHFENIYNFQVEHDFAIDLDKFIYLFDFIELMCSCLCPIFIHIFKCIRFYRMHWLLFLLQMKCLVSITKKIGILDILDSQLYLLWTAFLCIIRSVYVCIITV